MSRPVRPISETIIMRSLYDLLPECIGANIGTKGIGLPAPLDSLVPLGLPRGMVSILFSESGNFKTTIKANIVDKALADGHRVLDFSLEDSAHLVGAMRLSRLTGIPYAKIWNGDITENERERLVVAARSSDSSRLHFVIDDDEKSGRLSDIEKSCKAAINSAGLDLVSIDYAQLIDSSHIQGDGSERRGLEETVKRLQKLAKDANLAILLVSQVLRDKVHGRKDKRPQMRDLFGSSFLEFGCKLAIAAYRPWRYDDEAYEDFKEIYGDAFYKGVLELWIRKNRFGEVDTSVRVKVDLPVGTIMPIIEDLSDDSEDSLNEVDPV